MRFLAVLLSLGLALQITAQTVYGVHAGATATTFVYNEDPPVDWENLVSYNLGVPILFREKSAVSIQTGFDLVQRGGSYNGGSVIGGSGPRKAKQTYSYLEIPVLFRLGNSGEDASFHFIIGPSLNFGLSGKLTIGDSQDVIEFKESQTKRFELGGRVGAQLGFPVGDGRLVIDGRYRPGLTKLNDDDTDVKVTSSGFDVRLGYLISIGE